MLSNNKDLTQRISVCNKICKRDQRKVLEKRKGKRNMGAQKSNQKKRISHITQVTHTPNMRRATHTHASIEGVGHIRVFCVVYSPHILTHNSKRQKKGT